MFFVPPILPDSNKRLFYDVGVYNSDDDENVCLHIHQVIIIHSFASLCFVGQCGT